MSKKENYLKVDIPRDGFYTTKFFDFLNSIQNRGGKATKAELLKDLKLENTSGSTINTLIVSCRRYGLLVPARSKHIQLSKLGKSYFKESKEGKKAVLIEAFLNVPKFRAFFENNDFIELPKFSLMKDIVKREGLPDKYIAIATTLIRGNIDYLNSSFKEIKNFNEVEKNTSNQPIEERETKNEMKEGNSTKAYYKKGFELGILVGSLFLKNTLKIDDLQDLKDKVEELPNLSTEINRAIDQNAKGLLDEDKLLNYAKIYFKEALEKDLDIPIKL
ncbi:MAG: hypothetical protein ABIH20_03785 [Candidatus Diapherotrites archaeon]